MKKVQIRFILVDYRIWLIQVKYQTTHPTGAVERSFCWVTERQCVLNVQIGLASIFNLIVLIR